MRLQTLRTDNSFKEFCYKMKERNEVGNEGGSGAKAIFFFSDEHDSTFYASLVGRENFMMQGRQRVSRA